MNAAVTLLLGRAGTGKSDRIAAALAAHKARGERALLLVDEQYTFEAERRLCTRLGGLTGVQVTSFSRLAERLLEEQGAPPFLSAQGVCMAVRRAITRNKEQLRCFGHAALRPGFAGAVAALLRRCKQAGVEAEALAAAAERLAGEPLLSAKLSDLALLYAETDAFLAARYLSAEDAANAAIAAVPFSSLAGGYVYIDAFSGASQQQYRWMEAFFAACAGVTAALTLDPAPSADQALFAPARRAAKRLAELANKSGCAVTRVALTASKPGVAAPLAHLERSLFAFPARAYEGEAACVTLFGASDRQREVEAVADAVLEAARKQVRYRDMAVIVSDPAAYAFPLTRALAARGVPVFLDETRPLSGQSAAEFLLAAAGAACRGMRTGDVLTLLKTGCTELDDAEIEIFEQYILRYGVRGSALAAPFAFGEVPEEAERVRAGIMPGLEALARGLAQPPVSDKLRALYAYLETCGLRAELEGEVAALYGEGRAAEAEESAQVWNRMMELLSQLDTVFGAERMARADFFELLSEGMSGYTVGVVPGTADQLLLGDLERTKSRRVLALFLVGANDGLLPKPRADEALLDDWALARLAEAGLATWENTDAAAERDQLALYAALSRATESLFVSYAFTGDSAELAPAPLVSRIGALLPRCRRKSDLDDPLLLPSCKRQALTLLSADLRRLAASGEAVPRLSALEETLSRDAALAPLVSRMRAGLSRAPGPAPVPRQTARALFGETPRLSASRLERFFACPFSHFVRYGLGAAREKRWEERATDYGSLFHAVMDAFLRRCIAEECDFSALSDAEADALLDALLPETLAAHNDGFALSDERARAGLFLVLRSVRQAVHAMLAQLRAGCFAPVFSELRFGPGCPFPAIPLLLPDGTRAELVGAVDRVDEAKTDDGRRVVRVVDYKTGNRRFDFTELLHGLSLQLPLYLAAACAAPVACEAPEAAGLYYAPLRVPAPADGENAEDALRKSFRLKGLTLSDAAVLRCTEQALSGPSEVVASLRRNADESCAGALVSEGEMERLLDHARRLAAEGAGRMAEGEIAVSPAEGSCEYCDYKDVCRFDPQLPRFRARRFAPVDIDAFFGRAGQEETKG